jgi:hypothetical protein
MSAFIVSARHIDYLLTAGLRLDTNYPLSWSIKPTGEPMPDPSEDFQAYIAWTTRQRTELRSDTADQVGAMLVNENRLSVNARYQEDEIEEFYTFTPYRGKVTAVQTLKAIRCYEYQACEHEGWKTSEARAFCRALETLAIHALPGYDKALWEIPEMSRQEAQKA